MGAGESRVGWFGVVAGVRVGRPSCGSRMMPLAGLRISCGLREKRVHLAHSGRPSSRDVAVTALSCDSRIPLFAGPRLYVGISCNVREKLAYHALAGSWPLRGVRVAALSRGSCISPSSGQLSCVCISCDAAEKQIYLAFPARSSPRGFAVSQLSWGSRIPPSAGGWIAPVSRAGWWRRGCISRRLVRGRCGVLELRRYLGVPRWCRPRARRFVRVFRAAWRRCGRI